MLTVKFSKPVQFKNSLYFFNTLHHLYDNVLWIDSKKCNLRLVIDVNRYLGEKNYRFLMDLDNSYEPSADKYTITDKRIVKNGFNIVIVFNGM